jgi:hypothetical protein
MRLKTAAEDSVVNLNFDYMPADTVALPKINQLGLIL